MKTATRRRAAATQADLMEVEPGELLRRALSGDRIRLYHEGRRILIVDDSESTCKMLQRLLRPLYGSVEYETDPVKAGEMIKAAHGGRAYDAVVMDVFMRPKQGGQLVKELHEAGMLPAVVFNTGSMLHPFVSDAVNQWDTFKSEREMEAAYMRLRAERRDDPDTMNQLERPILFHHKRDESLRGLVAKIDFAQRLRQDGYGDAGEFLDQFKPMLIEAKFPDEATHKIVEEASNAAKEVTRQLAQITKKHPGFMRTRWYKAMGGSLEDTLSYLAGLKFDEVKGESETDRTTNLHEIGNRMINLRPPEESYLEREVGRELAGDAGFRDFLRQWREAIRKPDELVAYYHGEYRTYVKPELDVLKHARELAGDAGEVECEYNFMTVPGDRRRLMELVGIPIDAAEKRVAANQGSHFKVMVDWAEDVMASDRLDDDEKRRLRQIECKSCAIVEITDNAPAPAKVDDAYGLSGTGKLIKMGTDKVGVYSVEKPPEGGLKFRLLLSLDAPQTVETTSKNP